MKRPLFIIAITFVAGIYFAGGTGLLFPLYLFFAFASLALSLAFISRKILSIAFLLLLVFFSGAALLKAGQHIPASHIAAFTFAQKQTVKIKGVIATDVDEKYTKNNVFKKSFVLKTQAIDAGNGWQKAKGLVKVDIFGRRQALGYGELVMLEGALSSPKGPRDEDDFDYKAYLAHKNIYSVFSASYIKVIAKNKANAFVGLALKAKAFAKSAIDKHVGYPENLLMDGIILGQRQGVPQDINQAFIATGTVHILAISGLHVGLVAFILLLALKIFRVPRRPRFVIVCIFIVFYACMTGAKVPVIRASIMAIVLLLGKLFDRDADMLNLLGLSAILILVFAPQSAFEASFILSYASVLSILIAAPLIARAKGNYITQCLFVSLSVWLGIWPILAHYFGIVSFSAIFANLFVVPLAFCLTALGFLLLFCGIFSQALAAAIGASAWLCAKLLVNIVVMFSKLPFSFITLKNMSLFHAAVYYLLIASTILSQKIIKTQLAFFRDRWYTKI